MSRIITVTAKAASQDVVELASVKSELNITGSTHDAKIDRLIAVAGAAFSGSWGLARPPWMQAYSMQIPGDGGRFLRVPRWPIVRLTSVQEGVASPVTIDAADYSVAGPVRDRIYRQAGWSHSYIGRFSGDDHPALEYTVAGVMGWLMPGVLAAWAATTAYAVGDWAKPTSGYLRGDLLFECTTAGTSDGTEPTWPTTEGGTVTDSDVVWTARVAEEMPDDLQDAALLTVIDWFRGGLSIPSGVKRERDEGFEIEYFDGGSASPLPSYAQRVAERYR